MVKKKEKKSYEGVVIEILHLSKIDIVTASDLFTDSENPGSSSSSGSWT